MEQHNTKDNRRFLVWIPLALLVIIGLISFVTNGMLSMVDYKAAKGIFNSSFVGFTHYLNMLIMPNLGGQIGNSLLQTFFTLLAGLPLGVLLALALGFIRSRAAKAFFAGMALLLALVPDVYMVQKVLSVTDERTSYWLVFVLSKLLPQTALCVFGGLCLNLSQGKNGALGALVAGLLPLFTLFTPEIRINLLAGNALNQPSWDTLSTGVYRTGLYTMKFSSAAAVGTAGTLANLVSAAVPLVLVSLLAGRKKDPMEPAKPSRSPEGVLALMGALILGLAWLFISLLINEPVMGSSTLTSLVNTLLIALIAFIPAFVVCLALIACTRWCRGGIGLAFIALIWLQMSVLNISDYLVVRMMGLVQSFLPVAFAALLHPVFITVVIILCAARPAGARGLFASAFGGALTAAAVAAGDYQGGSLFISNIGMKPLAEYGRSMIQQAQPEADGAMLVLFCACTVLSAIAALLVMAGQKPVRAAKGKSSAVRFEQDVVEIE